MNNKTIGIIGVIIIVIVIIVCAFAFLGGNNTTTPTVVNNDNNTNNSYQLQINTTGKWRLDLTLNGKYSSDEGNGSKTIDLGNDVDYASVTVNQYSGGPTNVYLLKDNEVVDQGNTNSEGIGTVYFYYQT